MKIFVRRKHIRNGLRVNAQSCPVALALADATGHVFSVSYGCLRDCHTGELYLPMKKIGRFINSFDNERDVRPFTFHLKKLEV